MVPSGWKVRSSGLGLVLMMSAVRLRFKFEAVGFLIGREGSAVHQDAAVDKVEPPASRALKDAGHDGSGTGAAFAGAAAPAEPRVESIFAERAEQLLPVQLDGQAARADAAAEGALLSVFRRSDLGCAAGLVRRRRRRLHLLFGLLDVGVVDVLLLLLEGLGCGELVWRMAAGRWAAAS